MGILIQTKNIGRKFNEDGSVRFFPGNTIISKVKEENSIYNIVKEISETFRDADTGKKYSFLPTESFHMTMIQGVCEEDRKKELWTTFLPLDTSLENTDDFFQQKYKEVSRLQETTMMFDYIDITNQIIIVRFKPENQASADNLKHFRDEVSEKLGLRFPDHECYGFHISIAYQLWEMTEEERMEISKTCELWNEKLRESRPIFSLKQPELTYFDHMFEFHSHRIPRGRQ